MMLMKQIIHTLAIQNEKAKQAILILDRYRLLIFYTRLVGQWKSLNTSHFC